MPQPIETRYKGYRFRSRLEARWAVFFDSLTIEYQYEPEGFDLDKAGWYLPDFFLPQGAWSCSCPPSQVDAPKEWIEIKPRTYLLGQTDRLRIETLANHTGQTVSIIAGEPYGDCYTFYRCYYSGHLRIGQSAWAECLMCHAVLIVPNIDKLPYCRHCTFHENQTYVQFNRQRLQDAFTSARSARFEHGAKGG